MLFRQLKRSLSHSGSSCDAGKELAGTLTWKVMLLTKHQRKSSFALPFSCLHAFCRILSHSVACNPCNRTMLFTCCPYTLVTPAWSCSGLQQPHPVLSLCLPCCSAGLFWQECGSHCGSFCDYFTTAPFKDPGYTHTPAFQHGNKTRDVQITHFHGTRVCNYPVKLPIGKQRRRLL